MRNISANKRQHTQVELKVLLFLLDISTQAGLTVARFADTGI